MAESIAEEIRNKWEKCSPDLTDILLCLKKEPDIESVILHETMDALYDPKHL